MEENFSKKNNILGKVFTVLFLIWFVVSIIGIVAFSSVGNAFVTIIIFGQYFFVFSMVFFSNKDVSLFPLIHLTVGIITMIVPFILKVWPKFTDMGKVQILKNSIPILSIILGYIFLVMSRFKDDNTFKKYYIYSWIFFVYGIIKIVLFCI